MGTRPEPYAWRMSMTTKAVRPLAPIVLPPGDGRHYEMGALKAVFKADEVGGRCALQRLGVVARTTR